MNELMYNEWVQFLVFAVLACSATILACFFAWLYGGWLDKKSERREVDEHERLHERDLISQEEIHCQAPERKTNAQQAGLEIIKQ